MIYVYIILMTVILGVGIYTCKEEIQMDRSPWSPAIIFGILTLFVSLILPVRESEEIKLLHVSKPTAYYAIASDGNILQKFEDAVTVNKVRDGEKTLFKITRAQNIFGLPLGVNKIELAEQK